MKKWVWYAIFIASVVGAWMWYSNTGSEIEALERQIEAQMDLNDPKGVVSSLKQELTGKEGTKIVNGILLAFLSAGLAGVVFVVDVLPLIAQKATHMVFDSDEMVERDIMHDARVLFAQGDYEGAVEAYRVVARKDPQNRFPWVEIAKIQKDNLHQPELAVATLREALEQQEWETEDAAFFLFRLSELYDGSLGDRESAVGILNQVIELFPDSRHSANARHRLNEWERETAEHQEAGPQA